MAWEGETQDIDLWAAVRTILVADETELDGLLDRSDLVAGSVETEDPPSPHCAAAAAVSTRAEPASGSSDAGPFFAKAPTLSAAAVALQAKAPPPGLDEHVPQVAQPKAQEVLYGQCAKAKPVSAVEVKSVPAKPSGMEPPVTLRSPRPRRLRLRRPRSRYFEERTVVAEVARFPPPTSNVAEAGDLVALPVLQQSRRRVRLLSLVSLRIHAATNENEPYGAASSRAQRQRGRDRPHSRRGHRSRPELDTVLAQGP